MRIPKTRPQASPCDKSGPDASRHSGKQRPRGLIGTVFFILYLGIVAIALYCLGRDTDWRIVGTYLAIVSGLTYFLYGFDKWSARTGRWRTPESTLHLAELAGGWPAAFIAQRRFRHKTAKASYQVTFWLIAMVHQYIAADYMTGWSMAKAALRAFRAA